MKMNSNEQRYFMPLHKLTAYTASTLQDAFLSKASSTSV